MVPVEFHKMNKLKIFFSKSQELHDLQKASSVDKNPVVESDHEIEIIEENDGEWGLNNNIIKNKDRIIGDCAKQHQLGTKLLVSTLDTDPRKAAREKQLWLPRLENSNNQKNVVEKENVKVEHKKNAFVPSILRKKHNNSDTIDPDLNTSIQMLHESTRKQKKNRIPHTVDNSSTIKSTSVNSQKRKDNIKLQKNFDISDYINFDIPLRSFTMDVELRAKKYISN